jgi:hypothetical protein
LNCESELGAEDIAEEKKKSAVGGLVVLCCALLVPVSSLYRAIIGIHCQIPATAVLSATLILRVSIEETILYLLSLPQIYIFLLSSKHP